MSLHNKPKYQIPELIESLKAHGLDADKPSQLSDAFRTGWVAALAALRSMPAEPVHWRALLDPAQRPQKLQTAHHVIGFTNYKACEAFVAGELDMNGWRYTIEPLYNHPATPHTAPLSDAERWREFRTGGPLTVKCKKATVMFGPNPEPDYPKALDAAVDEAIKKSGAA